MRRIWKAAGLTVISAVAGGGFLGCCVFSAPGWHGPPSDHFDGTRFKNQGDVEEHGFAAFLKWQMEREQAPWPLVQEAAAPPGPPPPARVTGPAIRVTFVNHATVLIQQDGLNILTDPIWSERSSPVSFAGPRRIRPPGVRFEDLPDIDAVLLSHNHYDHLDLPTLLRIAERWPGVRIFAGLGNGALLRGAGLENVRELDWWQEFELPPLRVVSARSQHFSGRSLCDRDLTLWTSYVLVGPSGSTYFAGDTGYGSHFAETRERLGPMRLAVLPIGAYKPEWFMGPVHVTPAQAVQAARDLEAGTSVGMHFGTFPLADEGPDDPPRVLSEVLAAAQDPPRFWVLGFGEGRDVP